MPQSTNTAFNAQKKQTSPIWGMVQAGLGAALTPFIGAAGGAVAGAATGFLKGPDQQTTGGEAGTSKPTSDPSTNEPGAEKAASDQAAGAAAGAAPFVGPQQPQSTGPQQMPNPAEEAVKASQATGGAAAGPPAQGGGGMEGGGAAGGPQGGVPHTQDDVYKQLEAQFPELPFTVKQNPQYIGAAQNFLTGLQQRYLGDQGQGLV